MESIANAGRRQPWIKGKIVEQKAPFKLSRLGLPYIHLLDHSAMGGPAVPADLTLRLRASFQGLFILARGIDRASAEGALKAGQADLIDFARPFLAHLHPARRNTSNAWYELRLSLRAFGN